MIGFCLNININERKVCHKKFESNSEILNIYSEHGRRRRQKKRRQFENDDSAMFISSERANYSIAPRCCDHETDKNALSEWSVKLSTLLL